jgi:hypothetical protein
MLAGITLQHLQFSRPRAQQHMAIIMTMRIDIGLAKFCMCKSYRAFQKNARYLLLREPFFGLRKMNSDSSTQNAIKKASPQTSSAE